MIIKFSDGNLASTLRNKVTYEIFGKIASLPKLTAKSIPQPSPPRRTPTLSVVIRGANPDYTDEEVTAKSQAEGHQIVKLKQQWGNILYMIRVLTLTGNHRSPSKRRRVRRGYGVEPPHTASPLPIRYEKCQEYNTHTTDKCTNQITGRYCSELHSTNNCSNNQQSPKCLMCQEPHPKYS